MGGEIIPGNNLLWIFFAFLKFYLCLFELFYFVMSALEDSVLHKVRVGKIGAWVLGLGLSVLECLGWVCRCLNLFYISEFEFVFIFRCLIGMGVLRAWFMFAYFGVWICFYISVLDGYGWVGAWMFFVYFQDLIYINVSGFDRYGGVISFWVVFP